MDSNYFFTNFWKWMVGGAIVVVIIFSMTLLFMALVLHDGGNELRAVKQELTTVKKELVDTKQLLLEANARLLAYLELQNKLLLDEKARKR